jgi:hypothetical protein
MFSDCVGVESCDIMRSLLLHNFDGILDTFMATLQNKNKLRGMSRTVPTK